MQYPEDHNTPRRGPEQDQHQNLQQFQSLNQQQDQAEKDSLEQPQSPSQQQSNVSPMSAPRRVHPLTLLAGASSVVGSLVLAFAALGWGFFRGTGPGKAWGAAGALFVGALIQLIATLIKYFTFTWELTQEELVLKSGWLKKEEKRIPYRKIHTINTTATPVQRIAGLVAVVIDSGASGSAGSDKIELLKLKDADQLKRDIFAYKKRVSAQQELARQAAHGPEAYGGAAQYDHAPYDPTMPHDSSPVVVHPQSAFSEIAHDISQVRGIFAGDALEHDDTITYKRTMTNRELIIKSLMSASILGPIFACLAVFGQGADLLGKFFNVDSIGENVMNELIARSGSLSGLDTYLKIRMALIAVAILVLVLALSMAGNIVKYGSFCVVRRGSRFQVEKGLLSHTSTTVALTRIQTLEVSQTLLERAIGYAQVEVHTVQSHESSSNEDGTSDSVVLFPLIKLAELPDFLHKALPEFEHVKVDTDEVHLPKVALRRGILRALYGACVFWVLAGLLHWWIASMPTLSWLTMFAPILWTIVAVITLLLVLVAYLHYKISYTSIQGDHLIICKGSFSKSRCIHHRKKLQDIGFHQNPFQRRVNVVTLKAHTLKGSGEDVSVKDIAAQEADKIVAWYLPRISDQQKQSYHQQAQAALNEAGLL